MPQCGAPLRNRTCRLPAGWGTTHDGGRCWWHGGNTVTDLVADVLTTYRGDWLTIEEIQAVSKRARPQVNMQTVRVAAFDLIRSCTSVERRTVPSERWHGQQEWAEDKVQLRVR